MARDPREIDTNKIAMASLVVIIGGLLFLVIGDGFGVVGDAVSELLVRLLLLALVVVIVFLVGNR